ncbi:MAG: response regulator [Limnochordia bacterium]|nr:response regulator [Limnochordia bacterium]MDD2628899.1 response regulator [Limnochordia bacterium]MDD4517514.1 response regulator [Limnochordia bacterium]
MAQRILVVDDDREFLDTSAGILENAGYEVVTATSGKEARQIAEEQTFDLFIIDVMMEYADSGFVLCHELKNSKCKDVPIMIVTVLGRDKGIHFNLENEQERKWIKADAYVEKPINAEELLRMAGSLLKN